MRTVSIQYSKQPNYGQQLTKMYEDDGRERKEGFWDADNIPWPNEKPWKGQFTFLKKLRNLENSNEVNSVVYRGFSSCRLCKCANGSKEYEYKNWTWPEGFMHYVEAHNVKPTPRFIKFICG